MQRNVASGPLRETRLTDRAGDAWPRPSAKLLIAHDQIGLGTSSCPAMDHEDDDPGTTWNQRARAEQARLAQSPRMAWRAIQISVAQERLLSALQISATTVPSVTRIRRSTTVANIWPRACLVPAAMGCHRLSVQKSAVPDVPVVGFAGDGAFGIAVTELTAIGREEWPAVTMIVFRNYQWGAEKRNSTLWYEDNFIGTELDDKVSYAGIAQACGLQGVQARTMDELTAALHTAVEDQMKTRQDHADRGDDQPRAGRAVPPRRDEGPCRSGQASAQTICECKRSNKTASTPKREASMTLCKKETRLDSDQPSRGCSDPFRLGKEGASGKLSNA